MLAAFPTNMFSRRAAALGRAVRNWHPASTGVDMSFSGARASGHAELAPVFRAFSPALFALNGQPDDTELGRLRTVRPAGESDFLQRVQCLRTAPERCCSALLPASQGRWKGCEDPRKFYRRVTLTWLVLRPFFTPRAADCTG